METKVLFWSGIFGDLQSLLSYGGLKSQDVKNIFDNFCDFVFVKTTTCSKNFQNSVPKVFIATQIDVLCSNFVKFGQREIGEIMRCLPYKNNSFAWLSSCRCSSGAFIPPQSMTHSPNFAAQSPHKTLKTIIEHRRHTSLVDVSK